MIVEAIQLEHALLLILALGLNFPPQFALLPLVIAPRPKNIYVAFALVSLKRQVSFYSHNSHSKTLVACQW